MHKRQINKRGFLQILAVSMLLYRCTTWTLTKCMKNKIDGHYTWCFEQILETTPNKTAVRPVTTHLKNHQRRTRLPVHSRRSKNKLISDLLLWTPRYERASVGRQARTYLQQLCADTGYIFEERWMIGTEGVKKSRKAVLSTWLNDDDNFGF